MLVSVNREGRVFIRGLEKNPELPYLRKSRNSDWYWSSWWWLPLLKDKLTIRDEYFGKEYYEVLVNYKDRVDKVKRRKLITGEKIFAEVFKTKLWECQKQAASLMALAKRYYLADEVGLGKTLSSFAAIVLLREKGFISNVLIVTTSSIKYQWEFEIKDAIRRKYRKDYSICVIDGNARKRVKLYEKNSFIKIVNYESLRIDLAKKEIKDYFKKNPPSAVILDEASKIKNSRTKAWVAISEVTKNSEYIFALNATPIGNGYEELYGVASILDPNMFLCWPTFDKLYIWRDPTSVYRKEYRNVKDLKKRMSNVMLRRTVNSVGWEIPKYLCSLYWINLSKDQMQDYIYLQKKRQDLGVFTLARECALFSKNTPPEKSPKFKELIKILTDVMSFKKVVVFSESKKYLKAILPHIRKNKISCEIIAGDVNASKRGRIQRAFTSGNLRVVLCTSAGESGMNLQVASTLINLDLPWSYSRLKQRVGRLRPYMGGKNRKIRVLSIMARNTIEERVVRKVIKKLGYFYKIFEEEETIDVTGVFSNASLEKLL